MSCLHHGKHPRLRDGKRYTTSMGPAHQSSRVRQGATMILLACALLVGMAGAAALAAIVG